MVVFFDIDGTIVDNDSQIIPASAREAIRLLGENGHIAVVNTGRPYSHIDPRVRQLPFRGWICGCGMDVRLDGRQIFYTHPEPALCRFAIENARQYGMEALFEADDGSIVLACMDSVHPFLAREREQMKKKGFSVFRVEEHPDFMKMVTWDTPSSRRKEYMEVMGDKFTLIERENNMLEHVPLGCSKAEGMKKLLEAVGASEEDALAIGDSTNDLPMFSVARHTVCMGGGMEALKREAEFVTAPVLEDGIEKALRHYGLIP